MTVPRRPLGQSQIDVPAFALGSWHTYDRMDFDDVVDVLGLALDQGLNLFDVAYYGWKGLRPPAVTDLIWSAAIRALGVARDAILVSQKVWTDSYDRGFRGQLEHDLTRTGLDYADLAVLGDIHRDDLTMADISHAMAELADAGLIRAWGVNNWSAANIQSLLDLAAQEGTLGPCFAQLKYSVARRAIPDGRPFAALFDQGFVFEASDVMEGGFLAGNAEPTREVGRDPGGIRATIVGYLDDYRALADSLDTTPAQLSVAFSLTHPKNAVTLFGATQRAQLEANLAALDLVERVGAERLRELVTPFWADKDVVDPEGP
jgi:aryl-alcohol dehydrogenase-like predicted oxidoreductase